MYGDELPTSVVQQVTKIGNRAFLSVEESHHLRATAAKNCRSAFVSQM